MPSPAAFFAPAEIATARPRVVILGAGFGGLAAAKALKRAPVDVTLIDRRNYHLFQPLLYQVATAALSPAQIAASIRHLLSRQKNTTVLMDRVRDVDLVKHEVVTLKHRIPYDFLIVATGARHSYFGHDEWEKFAPGLKKIDDATLIRRRVLIAFEQAEVSSDEAERRKLLTFAIIGGGPTGVEMAGSIAELAKKSIAKDFTHIDPRLARVILIEAGPRVLPAFPEDLSQSAREQLEGLGVEVLTGVAVTDCNADGLKLANASSIEAATLIWAAGVAASPAAKWLKQKPDRLGRVLVNPDLTIPGHPHVFVIGDTASLSDAKGVAVPGIAPAAKQMGNYAARAILGEAGGPFVYRNHGNLATIGRKAAVADFGWLKLRGFPAWLVWTLAHIWFLIGFRNRFVVFGGWAWSYLTHERHARIITGNEA